jgi:TRAP-type C4-dicarboxylate transport system substrate-binding protein
MTEYKFYEIQKYMTLTRHVYSPHIDVASLKWWNTIDAPTKAMILSAIREAADYQRKDNREKDAARLVYLKEKGMAVEESPDLAAFRTKLVSLQSNPIYSDPRVNDLLRRMLEATR